MYNLYNGDCLEIMKQIHDKSIDMILCDLPYGTTACKWDNIIPFEILWKQYNRVIKDNGVIALFGSEPFSSKLRMSNFKMYKYDWIWEKSRPTGINFKNQPMRKHEIISIFCKNKITTFNAILEDKEYMGAKSTRKQWYTWNTGNGNGSAINGHTSKKLCNEKRKPTSILKFGSVPNYPKNLHPTQKPVSLLEYLIKTYTNENEIVLDNCMGSGSTGVACQNIKRNFIGIELDEKYFQIAKNRLIENESRLNHE